MKTDSKKNVAVIKKRPRLIAVGKYHARLLNTYVVKTSRWWDFQSIADPEVLGARGFTPISVDNVKTYQWIATLLGREPEIGDAIDFNDLLGQECLITVEPSKKDPEYQREVTAIHLLEGVEASSAPGALRDETTQPTDQDDGDF